MPISLILRHSMSGAPYSQMEENPMRVTAAGRSLAVIAAALLMSACVAQTNLPSDCQSPSVRRTVTLASDKFDPERIDLCKGQQVTITVNVQQDGELHFHGYDDLVPESGVQAGEEKEFNFSAVHVGQFPIEFHPPIGDEVHVGILTVYEP